MKITKIETLGTREFENVLWVRIHTDAGIIGLGETFYGAGAVSAHIHDTLAARLLGRDPLRIEAIHKELVNLPMAQSSTGTEYRAASAIDIALWDLWGKALGQPVYRLLGGAQNEIEVYLTFGLMVYTPEEEVEATKLYMEKGFRTFKLQGIDDDGREIKPAAERVRRLREAVG